MQTFALKKGLFSRQKGYNQNIKTINLHSEIQTNVKKIHLKPHTITNHSTLSDKFNYTSLLRLNVFDEI